MTAKEKDKIDNLEERMDKVDKALDRILFYLESDSATKQKGVIEKLGELEESVASLLQREEVYKGKATVWSIVGGSIVTGLIFLGRALLAKIGWIT